MFILNHFMYNKMAENILNQYNKVRTEKLTMQLSRVRLNYRGIQRQ